MPPTAETAGRVTERGPACSSGSWKASRSGAVVRLLGAILMLALAGRGDAQEVRNDSTHRAAVRRLMEVTHVRELLEQSSSSLLQDQLQRMPELAPYADIFRDFYREQLSWTALEPEYTTLYLEVFDESELRELIDFYETPLGQKLLAKMPTLVLKSNELVARRMQTAMPQLMQRLQSAMRAPPGAPADSTTPPR